MMALTIQTAGGERFLSGPGVVILESAFPKACPVFVLSISLQNKQVWKATVVQLVVDYTYTVLALFSFASL